MMKNRIEERGLRIESKPLRGARHTSTRSSLLAPRSSNGFSLVSAIFLLVVIAALGTFAVTLSTTQQQSAALDVMGARAYQAARAGVEWGAYQLLQNSAVAGGFAEHCRLDPHPPPTSSSVALTNTLAGFNVNVECTATSHGGGPATLWVYSLTSTATQGTVATPSYVERQMMVTIAQ
jgi:MSHA biogenesis protein MshP